MITKKPFDLGSDAIGAADVVFIIAEIKINVSQRRKAIVKVRTKSRNLLPRRACGYGQNNEGGAASSSQPG
jgi:hypothetical protein